MAQTNTEDLALQLEDVLNVSNLEQGPKLLGVVIADRTPNRGAVKSILKTAWQELGEAKITWVKDNVFAITAQDDEMARKILDNGQ